MNNYQYKDLKLLKKFIEEQFDIEGLFELGFFDISIARDDYVELANRICHYFKLKNVYEYGAFECNVHLTYCDITGLDSDNRPMYVDKNGDLHTEPFKTEIRNIYKE